MSGNSSKKTPSGESAAIQVEKLKLELRELTRGSGAELKFKIYDRMLDLAARLKKQYPDCRNYLVYHTLIGSSVEEEDKKNMRGEDFEGDCSIAKYYLSLLEDLKGGRV